MCQSKIFLVIAIIALSSGQIDAKPFQDVIRQKRTSDQRLAELETLIALSKMNGKLVTIPIGFGKIDPNKLGRRRRSVSILLQQLINDLSTEEKLSDEIYHNMSSFNKEEDGGEENEPEDRSFANHEFFEKVKLMKARRYPKERLPELN